MLKYYRPQLIILLKPKFFVSWSALEISQYEIYNVTNIRENNMHVITQSRIWEAKKKFPEINCSAVYVPPFATKDAVIEAVSNGIKI